MNVVFIWVYRENIGNIKGKLLDIKNRGDRIRTYNPNPYKPHKYGICGNMGKFHGQIWTKYFGIF